MRATLSRPRQAFAALPNKIVRLEEGPGSITYVNEDEHEFDMELSIPGTFMDHAA